MHSQFIDQRNPLAMFKLQEDGKVQSLSMCLEREENQKNYEVLMVTELQLKKKILSPGILNSSSTNKAHIKS